MQIASREIDYDRFCLREEIEAVGAFLSAPAALFEATPGRCVVESVVAVYPHCASIERSSGLVGFASVASPHTRSQAER